MRKRVVGTLSVDKARMSVVMLGRLWPRWFDVASCRDVPIESSS